MTTSTSFSKTSLAAHLAAALFPAGEILPAPEPHQLAARVAGYVAHRRTHRWLLTAGLQWLEWRSLPHLRRRFSRADVAQQRAVIETLSNTLFSSLLLRLLSLPFRAAYVLEEERASHMGMPRIQVPAQTESFRWQQQVTHASELDGEHTIEADVVVIGTGAGGAAAAYELASRGLAVVIIEEGDWHDRRHFSGHLPDMLRRLYRAFGATITLGNAFIPVPIGRNVGGTTTINSGTCMRTPPAVLARWRERFGLAALTEDVLAPWFDNVETMLRVTQAQRRYVGPVGDLIERGARALGLTQVAPLQRNAEGCDGQGLCQFGCPTDAKQSTNVSYIPRALERGAFLFTGMRATRLLRDGKQAQGVLAQGRDANGRRVTLRVEARATVVAMGALLTPLFLRANGVRNPHLGRHLTLHPCGVVNAVFPDIDLHNGRTIPQGFAVGDFAEQGLMFEGCTLPFAAHGVLSALYGAEFVRFAERYAHTAYFGFMLRDTSEGRVRRGIHRDLPWISYRMNKKDFALFLRGIDTLARIYFAAGASEVLVPGPRRLVSLRSVTELDAFMARSHRPSDFLITAYHPLGTARLAADASDGVCDVDHRVHGWQGLYVMDGSNPPTSLGANPQITLMTLASRAAAQLAETLTETGA